MREEVIRKRSSRSLHRSADILPDGGSSTTFQSQKRKGRRLVQNIPHD
jgi:hypothetical protein